MSRAVALAAALLLGAPPLHAAPSPTEARPRVEQAAATLAAALAAHCPLAAPADATAFDACKRSLYHDDAWRRALPDYVLWGRQRDAKLALKETKLTQFGPDVVTGLYLPLFMFDGQHRVEYVEGERLYQIRLRTAFRNRLQPGQFPYPFWHDADKWATYQAARELIVWWDPARDRIKALQFTALGELPPLQANEPVTPPAFDGHWMWTDAQGRTQPKVTVFDGLFRPANPYTPQIEAAYQRFALRLREGQCSQCHVPDNPEGMKRLVLLQTPAHAAGEIERLLRAVREDRMPLDDLGLPAPLDARTKAALIEDGAAFARLVEAAKRWESGHDTARGE